jgi:uncharacterized protein YegL
MDDIDKLLADISPSYPTAPKSSTQSSIDKLLMSIKNESTKSEVKPTVRHLLSPEPPLDDLLSQVKIQQTEKEQAEIIIQQEIIQENQRLAQLKAHKQEQLKIRQRQELRLNAQQWLQQLNPKSEESQWFEEFACNYESELEAAIEYLSALQEVDRIVPRP